MAKDNHKTEAAILKAAENEFMSKGFDGARTASIAAAAGVTHAMLHYYFRTKQALFERIVDDKFNLLGEAMLDAFRSSDDDDVVSAIAKAVEHHFDFVAANPQLPFFIINELAHNEDNVAAFRLKVNRVIKLMKDSFQDKLDRAVKQGCICNVDFMTLLSDVVSLNAFSIASMPLLQPIVGIDRETYLAERKRENVEVIRKRLLPNTPQ